MFFISLFLSRFFPFLFLKVFVFSQLFSLFLFSYSGTFIAVFYFFDLIILPSKIIKNIIYVNLVLFAPAMVNLPYRDTDHLGLP